MFHTSSYKGLNAMFPVGLTSNTSKELHAACNPQYGSICYTCLVVTAIKTTAKLDEIHLLTK
jgi:hypothetical protein